jgi:hypothetical protein
MSEQCEDDPDGSAGVDQPGRRRVSGVSLGVRLV